MVAEKIKEQRGQKQIDNNDSKSDFIAENILERVLVLSLLEKNQSQEEFEKGEDEIYKIYSKKETREIDLDR